MLSVKARALRLLALREHSRAELERKLGSRPGASFEGRSRGATGTATDTAIGAETGSATEANAEAAAAEAQRLKAEVHSVLDELQQHGLLSDERTADALLLAKAPRYGSRRIKQMLQAKSLDSDLVASTLSKARNSELDRAREVWRRRYGAAPADLRERARQQRFLAGRGFEANVIERVLKEAQAGSGLAGAGPDDRSDVDLG